MHAKVSQDPDVDIIEQPAGFKGGYAAGELVSERLYRKRHDFDPRLPLTYGGGFWERVELGPLPAAGQDWKIVPADSCGRHYPDPCGPTFCRYRGDRYSADQITNGITK